MQLKAGIYAGNYPEQIDGWRILCEQEKTPYIVTSEPDCPVLLCEGRPPEWLKEYLENGGIAVLTGMRPENLPFETDFIGMASLEYINLSELGADNARVQCLVQVYSGEGMGRISLHENRKIKGDLHPDEYPAVLWKQVGKGGCWYSGIPFSELICVLGDTLRRPWADFDFTERITSVDKHMLLQAMRKLLIMAYDKCGLPYVYLHYYPEDYQSVFVFRVDIDGIYGNNLKLISDAAKAEGIRVSFYANEELCKDEQERLHDLDSSHELGCHAKVHNLYTREEDNYTNVHDCREWMKELGIKAGDGFVAPRGMWNFALNRALEQEGIAYTSDFGYCISGLPFYPYEHGKRMAVKQIPVDAFSSERAYIKAEEEGIELPDSYVADYFCRTIKLQYDQGLPIILYSHPQFFGPLAKNTFPVVNRALEGLNVWRITLGEFDAWWEVRDKAEYSASFDEENGLMLDACLPEGVKLKVINLKGELHVS